MKFVYELKIIFNIKILLLILQFTNNKCGAFREISNLKFVQCSKIETYLYFHLYVNENKQTISYLREDTHKKGVFLVVGPIRSVCSEGTVIMKPAVLVNRYFDPQSNFNSEAGFTKQQTIKLYRCEGRSFL